MPTTPGTPRTIPDAHVQTHVYRRMSIDHFTACIPPYLFAFLSTCLHRWSYNILHSTHVRAVPKLVAAMPIQMSIRMASRMPAYTHVSTHVGTHVGTQARTGTAEARSSRDWLPACRHHGLGALTPRHAACAGFGGAGHGRIRWLAGPRHPLENAGDADIQPI